MIVLVEVNYTLIPPVTQPRIILNLPFPVIRFSASARRSSQTSRKLQRKLRDASGVWAFSSRAAARLSLGDHAVEVHCAPRAKVGN